jgi:hypothetical protein
MEISQKLQIQLEKAENLFEEAEWASREFLRMADEEGLSERYLRLGVKELSTFNILGSSLASR